MRARAGYRSQTALGRELGRERGAVAAWEADKSTPEPEVFPKLAAAIGVHPHTLLRMAGLEPEDESPTDPDLSELADQAAEMERRLRALAATRSAEDAADRGVGALKDLPPGAEPEKTDEEEDATEGEAS